jgi:antitoxin component YwqK of YwqJK toxin-antitoxin module
MKKILIIFLLTVSYSIFADLDYSLSDFCHLQPNVQTRGDVIYFPNEQQGITASSVCIFKDAYGQYYSKGKFKDGMKEGKWTWWYENGQKETEGNYSGGKPDGEYTAWHKNGQIRLAWNYKKNAGFADGKMTMWYENGQKEHEENYVDGNNNGKRTLWYENGQKQYEGNYKDDKRVGKWTHWYYDGQIQTEATYKDDECDVTWSAPKDIKKKYLTSQEVCAFW